MKVFTNNWGTMDAISFSSDAENAFRFGVFFEARNWPFCLRKERERWFCLCVFVCAGRSGSGRLLAHGFDRSCIQTYFEAQYLNLGACDSGKRINRYLWEYWWSKASEDDAYTDKPDAEVNRRPSLAAPMRASCWDLESRICLWRYGRNSFADLHKKEFLL